MIDINYQGIYDIIADTLPSDWGRVILHCMNWSGSCEITYYVKGHDGAIKDCHDLGLPDEVILNKSIKMLSLVNGKEYPWRTLTLIINDDGTFDAKADYTSNIDDVDNYLKFWSEQYLR